MHHKQSCPHSGKALTQVELNLCHKCVSPCQSSPPYLAAMSACHQRAADRMVGGAVRNGGIYIKLGQGLCSFNHLFPVEYIRTLQILEDKALIRGYKEVRFRVAAVVLSGGVISTQHGPYSQGEG